MTDYRLEIVEQDGVPCLHALIDEEPMAEMCIPLDDIATTANQQGYALYAVPDTILQKVCESQGYTAQDEIMRRLERIEEQLSEQGINELARVIEARIVSRMRYGRNPQIERVR